MLRRGDLPSDVAQFSLEDVDVDNGTNASCSAYVNTAHENLIKPAKSADIRLLKHSKDSFCNPVFDSNFHSHNDQNASGRQRSGPASECGSRGVPEEDCGVSEELLLGRQNRAHRGKKMVDSIFSVAGGNSNGAITTSNALFSTLNASNSSAASTTSGKRKRTTLSDYSISSMAGRGSGSVPREQSRLTDEIDLDESTTHRGRCYYGNAATTGVDSDFENDDSDDFYGHNNNGALDGEESCCSDDLDLLPTVSSSGGVVPPSTRVGGLATRLTASARNAVLRSGGINGVAKRVRRRVGSFVGCCWPPLTSGGVSSSRSGAGNDCGQQQRCPAVDDDGSWPTPRCNFL